MVDREYIEKNVNLIFEVEKRNLESGKIFHNVKDYTEDMEDSSKIKLVYLYGDLLKDFELKPETFY